MNAPRIPPVAIGLITGACMALAAWAVPDLDYELPASRIIAAALAMLGLAIAAAGVISFRRARTTVNPLQPGTASTLVATGIFRITRNPMYLGLVVVLFGWAVFLSNAAAFLGPAAFILYMNRTQIAAEEFALQARFGPAFADYRAKVRRWL